MHTVQNSGLALTWKMDSLQKLFNPRTIAVIGASDKKDRLGSLALLALKDFKGDVIPVNPRIERIGTRECVPSVSNIAKPVDLALLCLSGPSIPGVLRECGEQRIPSAIIFAAGYQELGEAGRQSQQEIKSIADDAHIAVIGPNCLGAGNVNNDLNATFFPHPIQPSKGSVALISQSGGVCGSMLYSAVDCNVGVSKFVSVGNRVNIEFHDLLRYFRKDEETQVICCFIEGTESGRELFEEMKAITSSKPVIAFKVGKTPVSRRAAYSHTGSLAGNFQLYSGAIKQAGGIEVISLREMMATAKILSSIKQRNIGTNVAILTHTLGPALIVAQALEEKGINLPEPPHTIQDAIQYSLDMPVKIEIRNPIDLLAQGWANPSIFADALQLVSESDLYDIIVIVFAPNFLEGIGGGVPVDQIIGIARRIHKPIVGVLTSPITRKPRGYDELEKVGIPIFNEPESAGIALGVTLRWLNR